MRKIVIAPNEILKKPASNVVEINDEVLDIVKDLKELVLNPENGLVGLSAPQIGESLRIYVINFNLTFTDTDSDVPEDNVLVFINPKIKKNDNKGKITEWEGCGSVPNVECLIERHREVILQYMDETGKVLSLTLSDYASRVAQHESDHLNGKLITDKAKKIRAKGNN